ncbi:TadE family protein [Catenulispora acidiphila DSM 44928]|uniref:TadE family protein n=1 Tax=Catenulispora acidiphila (strain DSM 44928 / JCM 14897 / NBRC 102108 / NRRL B-24433 / ID139908) TaxID=479433 RepID=C7PYU2_CATAD|nr:TadE/TadG family type IV pilus assembly protein [Catenulispora acidiphila]ACU77414.1 TadE family protein [Catenulispora acidiphila DSM 44928]
MTSPWRNDEGSAAAEMTLMAPLLVLLVVAVVQFGVWLHATHTAQAIAAQALQTARVSEGTAVAGREQAEALLTAAGRRLVLHSSVDVVRDAQRARVTIHGQAQQVLPFLSLPVNVSVAGPVERLTTAG